MRQARTGGTGDRAPCIIPPTPPPHPGICQAQGSKCKVLLWPPSPRGKEKAKLGPDSSLPLGGLVLGFGKRRRFRELEGLGWEEENVCPAEGVAGGEAVRWAKARFI